jgi:hypothetical protein
MAVEVYKKSIRIEDFFYPSYIHFTLARKFLSSGHKFFVTWAPVSPKSSDLTARPLVLLLSCIKINATTVVLLMSANTFLLC